MKDILKRVKNQEEVMSQELQESELDILQDIAEGKDIFATGPNMSTGEPASVESSQKEFLETQKSPSKAETSLFPTMVPPKVENTSEPKLTPQQELLKLFRERREEYNKKLEEADRADTISNAIKAIVGGAVQTAYGQGGMTTGLNPRVSLNALQQPTDTASRLNKRQQTDLKNILAEFQLASRMGKAVGGRPDIRRVGSQLVRVNPDGSTTKVFTDPLAQQRLKLSQERYGLATKKEGRMTEGQERRFKEKDEISDKQVEQIAGYTETYDLLDRIKKLKENINTGPYAGRAQSLGVSALGDQASNPDFVALRALVGTNLANYIKTISGAQVSEAEAKRLMKNVPTIVDDDKAFMRKLDEFEKTINRARTERIKSFRRQGKDPEAFEKVFVKPQKLTFQTSEGQVRQITQENYEKNKEKIDKLISEGNLSRVE